MVVRGMADRRIGVASPPRQDGSAIDDEIAPADEAPMARQADQHDEQALAGWGTRLGRAPALLGGAGHIRPAVHVSGQPTRPGQRGPGHQPVMQVLIRQPPQRAQQRQQQQ